MLIQTRPLGEYFNWDQTEFRRRWVKSPSSIVPQHQGKDIPLIVLDEIHKDRYWKRNLKGIYDTLESPCDFLITGSARLNVYRRGSDSLAGRYFHFSLHPFSLKELSEQEVLEPDEMLEALFSKALTPGIHTREFLDSLMAYGPFPEPLLSQHDRTARLWRRTHEQAIIREDLRDLSRLPDLGRLELLASLIPERIGSLLSVASLREDMEISFDTVRTWMSYLRELYYLFEIKPYSKRIPRSLRRMGKVYLWDYGGIPDRAAKFENLIACHLLKTCHYWSETGQGEFQLFFLRNKEKQEIDFLVVRDGEPWLPVEVKLSETTPSKSWKKFLSILPCKRGLQIVYKPTWTLHDLEGSQILVAGAAEALGYFA